jgi:hypothetical protein
MTKSTGDTTPQMQADLASQKKDARLGKDVQAKIGQQLRALYDDVVSQGVPDRFVDLLSRLDSSSMTLDAHAGNKDDKGSR